jgi:predicted TIM-barrel fold metal-dependent hydrolase
MDLPNLRHFQNGLIVSDPIEVCVDGNWIAAVLCQRDDGSQYWATLDMAKLAAVTEWRDAVKEGQVTGCSISQHQDRDEKGQTAKASRGNRAVKSRKSKEA